MKIKVIPDIKYGRYKVSYATINCLLGTFLGTRGFMLLHCGEHGD